MEENKTTDEQLLNKIIEYSEYHNSWFNDTLTIKHKDFLKKNIFSMRELYGKIQSEELRTKAKEIISSLKHFMFLKDLTYPDVIDLKCYEDIIKLIIEQEVLDDELHDSTVSINPEVVKTCTDQMLINNQLIKDKLNMIIDSEYISKAIRRIQDSHTTNINYNQLMHKLNQKIKHYNSFYKVAITIDTIKILNDIDLEIQNIIDSIIAPNILLVAKAKLEKKHIYSLTFRRIEEYPNQETINNLL